MDNRYLRIWTIGTASLLAVVIALVFTSYLAGMLYSLVIDIGTVPAFILFGYLWLLSLVGTAGIDPPGDSSRLQEAGEMGAIGGIVSLLFVTVVLVVGFVEPIGPLDPATLPVFRAVGAGTVVGIGVGGLLWMWLRLCTSIAAYVLDG